MNIKKGEISLLKLLIIIFFVTSTTFIAYYPALNNGFVWDTTYYVVQNVHIKALNWENIQWMFTSFHSSNWHPLTWLSHALDYAFFGLEPWGHHFVNILIHCLNTVLFLVLVIALISVKSASENALRFVSIDNKTLLAAGVAAILFGIHPQHVESVVWVAERKDVLCLFFVLLALLSYVFYNVVHTTKARFGWYLSTLLCFVLALLAKPMAITLPVILLLMDVYPLNRTRLTNLEQHNSVSYQRIIVEKIPFFMLTIFSAIITLLAQHHGNAISTLEQVDIQVRLLNAFNSLIFYISKFIFPNNLSPFYPLPSYGSFHEHYLSLVPIIAGFLITFVCVYLWYKKKKYYWLITWLFYLVTLSPVIGIIQVGIQAAANRYTYLPTTPFYILIGVGIINLLYQRIRRVIKLGTIIGLLLLVVVLTHLTQKQTLVWKNPLTLWSHVVSYAPDSALAQYNLGAAYSKIGRYEKAVEHYHQAVSLAPHDYRWYVGLPIAYIGLNKLPEALNILNDMIELKIEQNLDMRYGLDELHIMRGWIYFKQGRLQQAQDSLTKALQINPQNKKARKLWLEITSSQ